MMVSSQLSNLLSPGLKRRAKGIELFNNGLVSCRLISHDLLSFDVIGSKGDVHHVSFLDGIARCSCPDFHNRWESEFGAFFCSHIWACLEELKVLEEFLMKNNWIEDPEDHYLDLCILCSQENKDDLRPDLDKAYKNYCERKAALDDVMPRLKSKKAKKNLEKNFHELAVLPLQQVELKIYGKDVSIV